MKDILKDEEIKRRLDATARVFTKANRVLTGLPITCVVVNEKNTEAPSYTDGRTITFNQSVIGDPSTIEDIIRLTGLNLHEDAHVMFTPRDGLMVNTIRRMGMHKTFNVLEDQRIETLFTAMYPSSIPYFVSAVMRFCIAHEDAWESNYPLIHGRYYLPKDVRAEFKRRFARQDLIPQFVSIIDEYRKMVLPLDQDRALELVKQFHDLLMDMSQQGMEPEDPFGHVCGRPTEVTVGQPLGQQGQQEAADRSDAYDDAFNDEDDDEDDDSDPATGSDRNDDADPSTNAQPDPDADEADGEDGEDGEGDATGTSGDKAEDDADTGKGDGDTSGGDADGDADASDGDDDDSDLQGAGGTGAGSNKPDDNPPMDDDDFEKLMDDYAKAYEAMEDVQEDAADKQRSIVRGDGDITTHLPNGRYSDRSIGGDDARLVRAFSKELERLRADSDPGWATHRASGRVNVRRAVQGAPLTEIWDEWQEGNNDATDIEAVIALDTSGSMDSEIEMASRAMYVIKRALETVDASVTVLSFDYGARLVYSRDEKVSRTKYRLMKADGGTHAREAIIEAVRILNTSKRSNKLLIVITDGRWDDYGRTDEVSSLTSDGLIRVMGERGYTTALAHIGSRTTPSSHKCQVVTVINHANDLPSFARQIVTQSIAKKGK